MNMGKQKGNPNWKKGGPSPNPTGRPAVAKEFREKCREIAETQGVNRLLTMLDSDSGQDRRFALEILFGYAYGKPAQELKHSGQVTQDIIVDLRPVKEGE